MNIAVFSTQELPLVLQILTTVAATPRTLTPLEYQFLQVVNQLHQSSCVVEDLSAIAPSEIAKTITDSYRRKRLLQMAMVMTMVDSDITPSQQKTLRSLAEVFCVNEQELRVLHKSASRSKQLVHIDMMRQLMSKLMDAAYQVSIPDCVNRIPYSVIQVMREVFNLNEHYYNSGEDPEIAWKYRQLGLLPEGTLGRIYWEYCTQRRFSFPGEVGGIPESLVFHDFGHILSGYDTNPEGEIQQAAFQAGFMSDDGFIFLLFAILHFQWKIQMTPMTDAGVELLNIPQVIHALERGLVCKVDLSDNWNFWEVVDVTLEELRDRYGIPPLEGTVK
jgi:hypothetical protein